jgi:hypothetical protein
MITDERIARTGEQKHVQDADEDVVNLILKRHEDRSRSDSIRR